MAKETDKEVSAMQTIYSALEPFNQSERVRILKWAFDILDIPRSYFKD